MNAFGVGKRSILSEKTRFLIFELFIEEKRGAFRKANLVGLREAVKRGERWRIEKMRRKG
jgi:hypothetical protein